MTTHTMEHPGPTDCAATDTTDRQIVFSTGLPTGFFCGLLAASCVLALHVLPAGAEIVIDDEDVTVPGDHASPWEIGDLVVADTGTASLSILAGGKVEVDGQVWMTREPGSESLVTVSGEDAAWHILGNQPENVALIIAKNDDSGTLIIEDGGEVIVSGSGAASVEIGSGVPAQAAVTVTGPDSYLEVQHISYIGRFGDGTLTIEDGAEVVSVGNGWIGPGTQGSGAVLVTGQGTLWDIRRENNVSDTGLLVGGFGWGTLTIEDGAATTVHGNANTASGLGSGSAATVRGQDSLLEVSGVMSIGRGELGTFTVDDGGLIEIGEHLILGEGAITDNAHGVLNLEGSEQARGAVTVSYVEKGEGSAQIHFDGGVLRASGHQDDFLRAFASEDIVIESGGAFFDTAGYDITIATDFQGEGELTKTGQGVLTLTGMSIGFSGSTRIAEGSLRVDDFLAGQMTVESEAILEGLGTVGNVSVLDGGVIAPGPSTGTLSMDTLDLSDGSILEFDLGAPGTVGGGINDLIMTDGDLTLDGQLNISDTGEFAASTYTLMIYDGTLTDNGLSIGELPEGFEASIDTSQPGQIRAVVTGGTGTRYVAPEGDDADNFCLEIESPCATIAHAVDVAVDHDDIVIAAGIYTESLVLDKPVSLFGAGRDETIIQTHALPEEADERVILIPEVAGSATLAALTIRHGYASDADQFAGRGGGIHNLDADLTLVDVAFRDNSGEQAGGGLYHDGGQAWLDGVVFVGNASNLGGAINVSGSNASMTIVNTIFKANEADADGGAMYGINSATVELFNVVFSGNAAGRDGGALANGSLVDAMVVNSTFSGNAAGSDCGAVYNFLGASVELTNVIIRDNEADGNDDSASASICNEIDATTEVFHSLIANSGGSGAGWNPDIGEDGGNNLDADPLFVAPLDPADAPTESGDLRLMSGSPAIDAGDNDAFDAGLPDSDLAGYARLVGSALDLGAYETLSSQCPDDGVVHVDLQATEPADGLTWGSAFTDLHDALRLSEPCQIWVAKGTYLPTDDPNDRQASFTIDQDGLALYGGFAGSEISLEARDWETNETVLSGDINASGELSGNTYHVVVVDGQSGANITNATVIDGFVITGGNADGGIPRNLGGGLVCRAQGSDNECSPSISNVSFHGNFASLGGGGMFNDGRFGGNASPVLTQVSFDENEGGARGGGMLNDGQSGNSSPSLDQVSFTGNDAQRGGGMMNDGRGGSSNPTLEHVIFEDNSATTGAGMANDGPDGDNTTRLTNVVFSGNIAATSGGGLLNFIDEFGASEPVLTNVEFIGNSAGQFGGGMHSFAQTGTSNPTLTNVVFSGNAAADAGGGLAHLAVHIGGSSAVLTNVTFGGNSSANDGGAIFNSGSDIEVEIRNSLLWNNGVHAIHNLEGAHSTVSHSLAEGCKMSGIWATHCGDEIDQSNLPDEDPAFVEPVDPSDAPSTDGNLRLRATSPAIAAGNNEYVEDVPTDLDGHQRISGDGVDLGAFELIDSVFGDRFEQP